ncbi:mucin-2 [Streptomyces sp. NPDC003077]|uniref:mucin-2 n=1 Tax=Streptomyces sp. NPDC003077 TaxID=3154443 RepID=UPI0033A230B6
MPWFKIDDTAHAHPKLLKAGNAAIGLWLRAGAYAAQHLTEGAIPGVVVQLYGTPPQVRKLVAAGLWHEHGHACARCPQPTPGDYVMHDFLNYNPSRARVEDDRTRAAERQQRSRDKAAARRNTSGTVTEPAHGASRSPDESPEERSRKLLNSTSFPHVPPGQNSPSQSDAVPPSRSARPGPNPLPPTEVEQTVPTCADVPEGLRPLRDALTAAGVIVSWDLAAPDRLRLESISRRTAMAVLVEHACAAWHRARSRPRSVRYFLPGWAALPPVPEGAPTAPNADVIPLPAGPRRVRAAAELFAVALAESPQESIR